MKNIETILDSCGIKPDHPDYHRIEMAMLNLAELKVPSEGFITSKMLPHSNDGIEQEEFEAYAKKKGLDMSVHPMFYIFLDEKTNFAREVWREAMQHAGARTVAVLGGAGIKPLCYVRAATTRPELNGHAVCEEDAAGATPVYTMVR